MRDLLNHKAFQTFKLRCQSAGALTVNVQRREAKGKVRIQYHASNPRTKKRVAGEWTIEKGPDSKAKEEAFYDLLEAEFVLHSRPGREKSAEKLQPIRAEPKPAK